MKHFLTLFITALLAVTASGAANVGIGSQPVLAALTNGQYFVLTAGNASNSPVRLVQATTVSNQWAAGAAVMASNRVVVAAGSGVAVAPSGSGGVQTFTVSATGGGSGGTNFPNVNLLLGNTNVPIVAGIESASHQQTNASYTLNISQSGAFVSGQIVTHSVSNYGTSDITVTINTNSVAANPYDLATKTNVNTFTASASAITQVDLKYIGSGIWVLESVIGPTTILEFGSGITAVTNGVNGRTITISASASDAPSILGRVPVGRYTNSFNMTNLFSFNIPANTLGTNKQLIVDWTGWVLNNSGTSLGITNNVTLGGTNLVHLGRIGSFSTSINWRPMRGRLVIAAQDSASKQIGMACIEIGQTGSSTPDGPNVGSLNASSGPYLQGGTVFVDTTTNNTVSWSMSITTNSLFSINITGGSAVVY